MEMDATTIKRTTRLAGLIYVVWTILGLYGMMYIPSVIDTKGDSAAVAKSVLDNEFLFRVSIVNDLIVHTIWVFLVLVLYRLFKQVDQRQARLLFALVLVQIPAVFILDACSITSLKILKGELLSSFAIGQSQDVAVLFLRISDYSVMTLELFWGLWLFPLAILVYKSHFLPRWLGVWLAVNGVAYVILCLTSILFPQYKQMVYNASLPAFFGELVFALWLLIMGAKVKEAAA